MTKKSITAMSRAGVILLLLTVFMPLMAQVETTPMKPGRTPEGVVYFLPKTAIQFNLLIEKRTYTPGDFSKYAEKYLRLPGIEQEEQVSYSIARYNITQIGIRDTSKCFAVKLKGGKCENADIKLSDDGVLLAVNAEPVAQKLQLPFKAAPRAEEVNPRQYLNAEVLSAGSLAKMAELTVQQIIELQEHRQQLITGEADDMPQDEQQLRLMIEEIDKEREALMSMFTGTTRRDTTEKVIVICPEKEVKREVIFRLSQKLGLVDKDDLSGIPYYMTIEDLHHTTLQKYDIPENKKEGGFYVNVPGRIKLTLQREDHQLLSTDIYAAQFGFVELRSGSLFKRYVTHMTLNPFTGSVDKIHADPSK
jgi:hypothetical protein